MMDSAPESRKRKIAVLSEAQAAGVPCSSVVLGSRVRVDAARRSDLLNAISNTEGEATLPAGLSADDIRLWQAAGVLNCEPPTQELVKILKVADVLGDPDISKWETMLAQQVPHQPAPLRFHPQGDILICALLQLPSHIRTRVLTRCFKDPSAPNTPLELANQQQANNKLSTALVNMLQCFPRTFHSELVSCAISLCNGVLVLPEASEEVLVPLASAAFTGEGLKDLQIGVFDEDTAHSPPAYTAAFLGAALSSSNLSGLTSLHIGLPVPPAWLETLGSCVAPNSLDKVSHVSLHVFAIDGAVPAVASFLKCCPAITLLEVVFQQHHDSRQAAAAPPKLQSISSFVSSAISPTYLQKLREMDIIERSAPGQDGANLDLPSLLNMLLPLLSAPSLNRMYINSMFEGVSWPQLLVNLSAFDSLEWIGIQSDMQPLPHDSAWEQLCFSPKTHCRPDASPVLKKLQSVGVRTRGFHASLQIMAMFASAAHRSLRTAYAFDRGLGVRFRPESRRSSAPRIVGKSGQRDGDDVNVVKAWQFAVAAVRQCRSLRALCIPQILEEVEDEGFDCECDLGKAIEPLTALTWLKIPTMTARGWSECTLPGESLGAAFEKLAFLRTLMIGCCGDESQSMYVIDLGQLLSGLRSLKSLETLSLMVSNLEKEAVVDVVSHLNSLKKLSLPRDMLTDLEDPDSEISDLAAQFPDVQLDMDH